ncbi:MAG: peptidylprolyl isomerase [Ignavibacteriales bacterium]|nr:peptidylprolyl isomerase [Ignavibacteriales bacterium]
MNTHFACSFCAKKCWLKLLKIFKPFEDQVWARHILVATEDEAKKVIEELNGGAEWVTLAAAYSTDTSNKDNGGDLGWFSKGAMVSNLETAAFALSEVGQVSEPVQTQFGWHIIQLVGKSKNPIDASRFDTLKQTTFNDWLTQLRTARTDIVINDEVWMPLTPTVPEVPAAFALCAYPNCSASTLTGPACHPSTVISRIDKENG